MTLDLLEHSTKAVLISMEQREDQTEHRSRCIEAAKLKLLSQPSPCVEELEPRIFPRTLENILQLV